MTRFNYVAQFNPPAPFVLVTVARPDGTQSAGPVPAQLDTAADRTVIPLSLLNGLSLTPERDIVVAGLGGVTTTLPVYRVVLTIVTTSPITLEVAAHPDEQYILLGRDLLNHFRILLDGPQLSVEIQ